MYFSWWDVWLVVDRRLHDLLLPLGLQLRNMTPRLPCNFPCLTPLFLLAHGSRPALCELPRLQFFMQCAHPASSSSWEVSSASRPRWLVRSIFFGFRGNGRASVNSETSAAHLALAHASRSLGCSCAYTCAPRACL